jgi:hypothetical protein
MENIDNSESLPYQGEFHEADGEENAVNLGNLQTNGMLGIWLKRSIVSTVKKTNDQLYDDFVNGVVQSQREDIQIKLDWQLSEENSDSSESSSS